MSYSSFLFFGLVIGFCDAFMTSQKVPLVHTTKSSSWPKKNSFTLANNRRSNIARCRMQNVDPEDPQTKKKIDLLAATLRYMRLFDGDSLAMFGYDGSEESLLLGYAAVKAGGKPVVLGPDVPLLDMQKSYFDNRCVGVIVPDQAFLQSLLALPGNDDQGKGLESYSGYDPYSPVTPRFVIVCKSEPGVTGKMIQEKVGGSGREVDEATGFSWQVGRPIPCFTMADCMVELLYGQLTEKTNYARNRQPWDL